MARALALAVLIAALAAAPAAAAVDAAAVARSLARSPVYVDPAVDDALRATDRRRILRAIGRAPDPVYVVVVPLVQGDAFEGDPENLLAAISGRVGRPGIYVTMEDGWLHERAVDVDDDRAFQASIVANDDAGTDAPAAEVLDGFLRALSDPRLEERYERTIEGLENVGPRPSPAAVPEDDEGGGFPWLLAGGLALLALLAVGAVLALRRRAARYASGPPVVLPERVFEHARASAERDLRTSVERQVVALAEALERTDAPAAEAAQDAYQRALDGYAAARKALDEASDQADLAGALVLVDRGRADLAVAAGATSRAARAICFFNPLHGHAAGKVTWQRGLRVPACGECTTALRRSEAPDALMRGGRPYFEGDGVWARTGYGAFADDLAGRILRGDA